MIFIAGLILTLVAILLLFVVIAGIFYVIDLFLDLPYVGAKHHQIETIIKLANIRKGETLVDLGSGDGRLLFAAAAKGAIAVGYELNPFLVVLSRLHAQLKGLSENVMVHRQNMWQSDLKVANVIFVYSLRSKIKKFEDFIWQNAKKGTRVIVNTNPFPNKKPVRGKDEIFLYKV